MPRDLRKIHHVEFLRQTRSRLFPRIVEVQVLDAGTLDVLTEQGIA